MAIHYIPIDHYKTKLYQRENLSENFKNTTEEDLAIIAKKVYKRLEIIKDSKKYGTRNAERLDLYQNILMYLTNPSIHMDLPTYDERIAFLIMSVDPELITYKEFLNIELLSFEEISKVENKKERSRLFEERNNSLNIFESRVREQLGFFDVKLLKFEEIFFKKFYSHRELITEVKQHNEDKIEFLSKMLSSFNSISDKRYNDLINIAQVWLSHVPDKYKIKIAIHSITKQRNLLGLNTLAEQLAFFILVVDPELDMLRIYEEESMIPKTETRIIEEFGYYHPSLISLEQKYHERFCPNKKVSIWSETK